MRTFVKSSDWQKPYQKGWGNGYVIIPKGHRFHGKHYDEIPVDVHGGLTFSEYASDLGWPELADESDGWVVGFDTGHFADNASRWTKENVIKETEYLKQQLL